MAYSIEQAFRTFGPSLLRHAAVLVGPANADDLVSEAIVGALVSPSWETVAKHEAYLHRAVLNAARARARSNARSAAREWAVVLAELPPEAERLPRPDVIEAVKELSVRQRSVVFFTYWEDLSLIHI